MKNRNCKHSDFYNCEVILLVTKDDSFSSYIEKRICICAREMLQIARNDSIPILFILFARVLDMPLISNLLTEAAQMQLHQDWSTLPAQIAS